MLRVVASQPCQHPRSFSASAPTCSSRTRCTLPGSPARQLCLYPFLVFFLFFLIHDLTFPSRIGKRASLKRRPEAEGLVWGCGCDSCRLQCQAAPVHEVNSEAPSKESAPTGLRWKFSPLFLLLRPSPLRPTIPTPQSLIVSLALSPTAWSLSRILKPRASPAQTFRRALPSRNSSSPPHHRELTSMDLNLAARILFKSSRSDVCDSL